MECRAFIEIYNLYQKCYQILWATSGLFRELIDHNYCCPNLSEYGIEWGVRLPLTTSSERNVVSECGIAQLARVPRHRNHHLISTFHLKVDSTEARCQMNDTTFFIWHHSDITRWHTNRERAAGQHQVQTKSQRNI